MNFIDCAEILVTARGGPSRNVALIEAALDQAFRLTTEAVDPLCFPAGMENVPTIQVMRYGSSSGGWTVEDSDLDVVVVICTHTDNEEKRSALETAFLCLYFCYLHEVENVRDLQKLINEKGTVSYRFFLNNLEKSLKVDLSVELSSKHEHVPWKVQLTRSVEKLLRRCLIEDVACDIARIIITWAKKNGHCHNGNTTTNLHISGSQYRLRSIHWALLVAYALSVLTDPRTDSLQLQVHKVLRFISKMSFRTHLLIVNTSENPEIVWKPRVEETRGGSERTQFWIMHCHYDDIIQQNMARKANYVPDKRGAECLQEAVLQASQCIML